MQNTKLSINNTYITCAVDQTIVGLEVGQIERNVAFCVAATETQFVPDLKESEQLCHQQYPLPAEKRRD